MKDTINENLKYWYAPLLLGLLFLGLGILVFATPLATFLTIAFLFSIGFLVSGIVEIGYALSNRKHLRNWGWYLAGGIVTLIMGLLLTISPGLTAVILSLYIGFWLLFRSVLYAATAFELKNSGTKNWGWVLIFGILGVILSFIVLSNPAIAGLSLVFWIGFGLISLGIINIILSFSIRKIKKGATDFFDQLEG